MELDELRAQIDSLDDTLCAAFEKRMELCAKIAQYKADNDLPVLHPEREQQILSRLTAKQSDEMAGYTKALYQTLFDLSRTYQSAHMANNYYLIGKSIAHSHSPAIHRAFGNDGYSLRELNEDELAAFFKQRSFKGLNVTVPYKQRVLSLCDVVDPAALSIGSVNTVVNENGVLHGYNTDIIGIKSLFSKLGVPLFGKRVLILGSGGTSHTAKQAALEENAADICIVSRSGPVDYANVYDRCPDTEIIINTTPVGMSPNTDAAPIDLSRFSHLRGVIDVVYTPLRTRLLSDAERLRIPCIGGLQMLVVQAAAADTLFRGARHTEDEIDTVYQELRRSLQNIVLIGMPGCGKTTVGKQIAGQLQKPFFDTDALIESAVGKSVPAIFSKDGEEVFRQWESRVIFELSQKNGAVIATGGGSVLRKENCDRLRQNGFVIYLNRPLEKLDRKGRPLSVDDAALARLYAERHPLYESAADIIIERDFL